MDFRSNKVIFLVFIMLYTDICALAQCGSSCRDGCDMFTRACINCVDNKYGRHCENDCSGLCQNQCDRYSGNCDSCKAGRYASWCLENCSAGCVSVCDMDNGNCIACKTSTYGSWCTENCPLNCVGGCNRVTGDCLECEVGYYGRHCNVKCIEPCSNRCDQFYGTCNDCDLGSYGGSCEKSCPENCQGNKCVAPNGHCIDCNLGFYGHNCVNACPGNCNGACDFMSGDCFLCLNGFYSSDCSTKCPENCLGPCSHSGQCFSCKAGYHGKHCADKCSEYCKTSCEQNTGECYGCVDGIWGTLCNVSCGPNCQGACNQEAGTCDKCVDGWHGRICDEPCPANCQNKSCFKTGLCVNCTTGYYGNRCDQECVKCRNDTCLQSNGVCTFGCSEGFYGVNCDETCDDEPRWCTLTSTALIPVSTSDGGSVTHAITSKVTTIINTSSGVFSTTQPTRVPVTTTTSVEDTDKESGTPVFTIVIVASAIVVMLCVACFTIVVFRKCKRSKSDDTIEGTEESEETYDEIGQVESYTNSAHSIQTENDNGQPRISNTQPLSEYTDLIRGPTNVYTPLHHVTDKNAYEEPILSSGVQNMGTDHTVIETRTEGPEFDNDGYERPVTVANQGYNQDIVRGRVKNEISENVVEQDHNSTTSSAYAFVTNATTNATNTVLDRMSENSSYVAVVDVFQPVTGTVIPHAVDTGIDRMSESSAYAEVINAVPHANDTNQ